MMKVLLEAPILTQSGYGEHARLVFRSLLLQEGIEIYTNPLNWGRTSWASSLDSKLQGEIQRSVDRLGKYIEDSKQSGHNHSFDVQIHVGIPSEFEKKAPHSICVTAGIETDRVSPEWIIRTHRGLDKLIVPSEHAKSGFVDTSYEVMNTQTNQKTLLECTSPIQVVGYPVKNVKTVDLGFEMTTEFNFLSVALLGPRKNLENMVKWFIEEFKDENVGLLLKTGLSKGGPMDLEVTLNHLRKAIGEVENRKCKVYLLHGDLEEGEVHSLYLREDVHAYISATHGEGYGLPIFEAACYGLPIVATDWSAHTEFLSAPYKEGGKTKDKKLFAKVEYDLGEIPKESVWKDILVEGSKWANPKKSSFRKQLRNMYKNHGMYKKWAEALKKEIEIKFSEDKILKDMSEALLSDLVLKQDAEEEVFLL